MSCIASANFDGSIRPIYPEALRLADVSRHSRPVARPRAMDGTTLRTAASPASREHFGAQRYVSGKISSYPQVRAVNTS